MVYKEIFDIAKRNTGLARFGRDIRMHYLKGNAVKTIARLLDGNIIEPLEGTVKGIMQYRIK